MKKTLLIYGAGAIGRGFIPWVFPPEEFEFDFVEADTETCSGLNKNGRYSTYKTIGGGYQKLDVPVARCFKPGEENEMLSRADAVITAVGPRNFMFLSDVFINTRVPIICCENDAALPELMSSITGNPNIVFAIPDVITSNTAPRELKREDPLSVVTEDGVCFVDEKVSYLGGVCKYVSPEELRRQWLAKLYIHNTPHCIAAYLGSFIGLKYLHEAMQNPAVEGIVAGAMHEMKAMLLRRYGLDEGFVVWYSEKELQRFGNTLLFDPISRVAREPFRKLAHNDRLIGAAELCVSCGVVPDNIIMGIMAAFCYGNSDDPDFNIRYLVRSLKPEDFLRIIIRLRQGEALFEMIKSRWDMNLEKLRRLRNA